MHKGRLEAFSDGVIAIIITIMVLELKVPEEASWHALNPLIPKFLSYLLSFIYVGLYWNNHHHMWQVGRKVNGAVLWANLHFLFWLSLFPFTTAWLGETNFEKNPAILYGIDLVLTAFSWSILEYTMKKLDKHNEMLMSALKSSWKEKASIVLYILGIGLAFIEVKISLVCYAVVAIIWIVPDKRIEKVLNEEK